MRPLLAALAVASLAVAAPAVPAAHGQDAGSADVTLVDQDPWVATGEITMLRVRIDGPIGGRELRLDVHAALSTRTAFEQTVDGDGLGPRLEAVRLPFDERPPGANGELVVPLGAGDDIEGLGAVGLPVSATGVYPVRVSVGPVGGSDDEEESSFVTWLVVAPTEAAREPLGLAWIWSVAAPPALDPQGAPTDEVLAALGPGGELEALAGLLQRAEGLALTLVVSPQTVAVWEDASRDPDLRPGLVALREAARRTGVQVVASPYVPLDLPAVARTGLSELIAEQMLLGVDTLERVLGVRVDPRTAVPGPLDDAALARLRALFVDRLVIPDGVLEPVDARLTPARPFVLEGGGSTFRAIAANEGLRDLLDRQGSTDAEPRVLRAQRFLAGLSLVALEEPARARGVTVAEAMPWSADPALVDRVLQGLAGHPLVRTETLAQQFARVDDDVDADDEPLVRTLEAIDPGRLAFSAGEYEDVRARLVSFASVVGGDDPLIARGEEALRVAPSSLLDDRRARAELSLVHGGIATVLADVRATDKTVTLTSSEAEIPVSLVNGTDDEVTVRMRLESSKLLFPGGAEQTVVLPPGNTTLQVPVEARASGTFTMNVELVSTDGYLSFGDPARIRVRSTVFSGMGAFLTGGAAAFLVLWWGNHIRRTRRSRRSTGAGAAE